MNQKMKFIIIGLAVFSVTCLFLFIQATSQQQTLLRESSDLKAENSTLNNKIKQLESDLRQNQGRIEGLKSERDKASQSLNELQGKLEQVSKTRDELAEKIKQQNHRIQQVSTAVQQQSAAPVFENTDAYWGSILKDKTDLQMQLVTTQQELRNLQINNEALQREKSILEIDMNRLTNEKKDLLRQLDYNQKLLDSMSQEVVRERNDKVAIQENFKSIKSENEVLSRQLRSLTSRKELLDKKVQDLQEGKNTVGKRLNEMETMLTDKISQIDSLKTELDAIRSGRPVPVSEKKRESVELPAIVVRSSPASGRDSAEIPEFTGKVLAVNTDNDFVVIDQGSAAGVKVGDQFNVYRAGKFIGNILVIQARDNISACDIKRVTTPIKIGDNIK
ncbi:MAG: hypothetical protein PHY35_04150 [Candidatus Omnitrophica bacterium]|nr:hypothetical protein [Candidatus Omnitrophota bacterium]